MGFLLFGLAVIFITSIDPDKLQDYIDNLDDE